MVVRILATLAAVAIFGYGVFLQHQSKEIPAATPISTPSMTAVFFISPTPTSVTVYPNKLIYPGAKEIARDEGRVYYEIEEMADKVFSWYKNILDNDGYHIRNSIRTKSNDKFKGVLHAEKSKSFIKITIDQDSGIDKVALTIAIN